MKITEDRAAEALRLAAGVDEDKLHPEWLARMTKFSELCASGVSKTHIAFLGTSLLARAVSGDADLFAIKPKLDPDNSRAYSARTLSENVLVPLAAELGINLGTTGRQPLNNQPYFRMSRLDDGTPVHPGGRRAFDYMLELVRVLQDSSPDEARLALAAYVAVRRKYRVTYAEHDGGGAIFPNVLAQVIRKFVLQNSEGGRRAQAIAAGVFDVVFGMACVESGRINDPSRNYPGDVCIRREAGRDDWIKAVEVRDKPVSASDVQIFANRCAQLGVREAAVLMVSERQSLLDETALQLWADNLGIGLTLFSGWDEFIGQALFWASDAKPEAAALAIGAVRARLIAVEVSTDALVLWDAETNRVEGG